jgi:HD-GYP domain-containing protein (c-di-GMP phosphodiesterase class II)
MDKHSLHTFVHRTLVYRLVAVGLSLSLLIGLAVLLMERDRVSREAIDMSRARLAIFSDHYNHLLSTPNTLEPEKLRQAMIEFRATRSHSKLGSFVFLGIYDVRGTLILKMFNEQLENIDGVKKKQQEVGALIPEAGKDNHNIVRIKGRPYQRIALNLVNSNQETVGIINGFFAFSTETIDAFRLRGLRSMFLSMAIVLLTTAMLYPIILRLTQRITRFSVKLLKANLETLEALGSAIAQRDSDTNAHNYRVSIYAVRLAEEINLPNQPMRSLIKGSFLHDVGKIGIPDNILLKPGKLDDNEFEVMKTHVEHGRDIIQRSEWLHDALEVILSHHEKLAGEGYPMGLMGGGIPVAARIFAIADVFDALTSKRPYKKAFSFEEAMDLLEEGRESHFDPILLDAFSRIAKPLYDQFGGKEEIFRDELAEIITQYFHQGMDGLEY